MFTVSPQAPDLYDVAAERFQGLPDGSWWLNLDRAAFALQVKAEAGRMRCSKWGQSPKLFDKEFA